MRESLPTTTTFKTVIQPILHAPLGSQSQAPESYPPGDNCLDETLDARFGILSSPLTLTPTIVLLATKAPATEPRLPPTLTRSFFLLIQRRQRMRGSRGVWV